MSCCFMFYPFKPMDTSKSDVQSSVAEYLEKEKLCQEICETITKSVEGQELQGNCSLPKAASSLLPEFNSDEDVEDILQQISDLLGSQLGDTSQCTDIEGIDDLSVDEILKQAEQIVRASTPYFERKTYNSCTGVEPLLEPIRRGVKQLGKRYVKPVPQYQTNLNESSRQDVNRNTKTEIPTSRLEVKNDVFDRNGNSPTPTNDSDDEVYESPEDSSGPETPLHNDPPNIRKSCSDTECHLKATNEVRKSSSAGTCDIVNMCVENLERLIEEGGHARRPDTQERVNELTLSDLRVSPQFCSKEAILPEGGNANRNAIVDQPLSLNKNTSLDSLAEEDGDHSRRHLFNEVDTASAVEITERKPSVNEKGCTVINDPAPAEDPKESQKTEVSKNTGRSDQKPCNRKADESSCQTLAVAKHEALRNVRRLKSPTKSSLNAKSSGKGGKEGAEKSCPNEEHCSVILDLRIQIESLSNKIIDYEKFEARARKNETLAAAERQRAKLLQEEVKSQEELIVGYQRENQRLSNDILSAKFHPSPDGRSLAYFFFHTLSQTNLSCSTPRGEKMDSRRCAPTCM